MFDDVAEVLERAADALFIHGRCHGQGADAQGRMCIRGAIAYAQGRDPQHPLSTMGVSAQPAVRTFEQYLHHHPELIEPHAWEVHSGGYFANQFPSWIWNDTTHGRCGDEMVIDALRSCAKDLRNAQVAA